MPSKPSILVVDDTPENLDVLKGALREHYMFRPAISGMLALKFAEMDPQPDLILLDIMMPEMDGYEVCRRLKANPKTQNIPVIFVTARSKTEDELKGLAVGAVDYILKPISPPIVQARVKTHLALKQAQLVVEENNKRLHEVNARLASSVEQLSASEERFRNLVQTIPDIVYKIDSEGYFTFINKSIERLGFHQSELIGRHFTEIIHGNDIEKASREKILENVGTIQSKNQPKMFDEKRTGDRMTVGLEIRLKTKSGTPAEEAELKTISNQAVVVEVNSSGLYGEIIDTSIQKDRTYVGTVGVIRDITERKRFLDKLKTAKETAEDATKLKDKFVSLVAHDLRSPLSSIVGLMEHMIEDQEDPLSKNQNKLTEAALISGQSMLQMIEEILNIGRLQTGKITPEKSFLSGYYLVQNTLNRLDHLRSKKNLTIHNEIHQDTRLYADNNLFAEVIQNLVSNAIKFSEKGDTIRIFTPDVDPCSIFIQDQGVGIPKDVIPKLFNIAEKVSTQGTEGEQGTGFGLPFSFDIMEAHGGTIEVESILNQGTTFQVSLPFVRPKILVVDDNLSACQSLLQLLKPLHAELLTASNGEEALAIIQEFSPHLILADLHMPMMDGFGLLKEMGKRIDTKNIPCIVLTADKELETRDKAYRLGAVDFMVKPPQIHDFLPRIRHILGKERI